MTPGEKTIDFYCSGLMPVRTSEGVEMRKVAHHDFDNMLRTPELRDGESLMTCIDGTQHVIRTY